MIALIRKIRETLQGYADNHLAKSPPQPEKARVNMALVHEINDALVALATPPVLTLTEDMMEVVRDPDILKPGPVVRQSSDAQHIPSLPHLIKFVETLATRDEEDYCAVRMRLADLRSLTGVDEG